MTERTPRIAAAERVRAVGQRIEECLQELGRLPSDCSDWATAYGNLRRACLALEEELPPLLAAFGDLEDAATAAYHHFNVLLIDGSTDDPVVRALGVALGLWVPEEGTRGS